MNERPFQPGECYTLDSDPNDWYGYWCSQVVQGLRDREESDARGQNALYNRLDRRPVEVHWPAEAAAGQARFLEGLDALRGAGAFHDLEESKREYIARHGEAPTVLVQGPPGTGKSYSTAIAWCWTRPHR